MDVSQEIPSKNGSARLTHAINTHSRTTEHHQQGLFDQLMSYSRKIT